MEFYKEVERNIIKKYRKISGFIVKCIAGQNVQGDACVGLDKIKNMLLRAYIIIKKENSYACLSILHAPS